MQGKRVTTNKRQTTRATNDISIPPGRPDLGAGYIVGERYSMRNVEAGSIRTTRSAGRTLAIAAIVSNKSVTAV